MSSVRAFPQAEYERRLRIVQAGMKDRDVQVLLALSPHSILYLTGFQTFGYGVYQLAVIPAAGPPVLLVRELEAAAARVLAWSPRPPVTYQDEEDPVRATAALLRREGFETSRIGLELRSRFLSVRSYLALVTALDRAELVDGSELVERARKVKSALELESIRTAAGYTAAGMAAAMEALHDGVVDQDVAAAAASGMLSAGSEYLASGPTVTSGRRSGIPHTTFARQVIRAGDCVLLEMGGVHDRYTAPLMRTAALAPVPDLARAMHDACSRALDAAIAAIRPGVTAGQVHAACQRVIDAAGFEPNFRKRTGYSMGVSFAPGWAEDYLHLAKDDQTPLEAGMVFHIPPALREHDVLGVGCSETVVVTASGAEILTDFPRELRVVMR